MQGENTHIDYFIFCVLGVFFLDFLNAALKTSLNQTGVANRICQRARIFLDRPWLTLKLNEMVFFFSNTVINWYLFKS